MMTEKSKPKSRRYGFSSAAALIKDQVRVAGESRGFAVSRLLTHWEEIAGEDTARIAIPVKVSYSQGGFGATLTLLTTGSHAPILQTDIPRIMDRVNACYGYAAIARIRITQTAPSGFSEGQVAFQRPQTQIRQPTHDPQAIAQARKLADTVADQGLRGALEQLGKNVLSRKQNRKVFK